MSQKNTTTTEQQAPAAVRSSDGLANNNEAPPELIDWGDAADHFTTTVHRASELMKKSSAFQLGNDKPYIALEMQILFFTADALDHAIKELRKAHDRCAG